MKKLTALDIQKGFTLIELLIVVVIIGILAGIVITILNPERQQRRARDGVIVATMNKIGADVKAYGAGDISGQGEYPTCGQLSASIENDVGNSTNCDAASDTSDTGTFCIRGVNGNPDDATGRCTGANSNLARFTYVRYSVGGSYRQFCLSTVGNDQSSGNNYIRFDDIPGSGFESPRRSASVCP